MRKQWTAERLASVSCCGLTALGFNPLTSDVRGAEITKWVNSFGPEKTEGRGAMKNLLGGKGANLAEMAWVRKNRPILAPTRGGTSPIWEVSAEIVLEEKEHDII
jgi:hypothetical protein